tara:strand:- start:8260 stop:8382 length:123 start_codon:yes stop_codon:yes gene_type:complete
MIVEISKKDSEYLYWLLRTEAYNQKEDKKEILQLAKKFKV